MEKEGAVREERGRKARIDIESIKEQLEVLGGSAKKVEDKEKRRRYEGFEKKRPVKLVAGLVLKKDTRVKFVGLGEEGRVFFGGGGGALGVKTEPLIASGSSVSPEAKEGFRSDVWQMEFVYRL